jgi:hypothetical protein
MGASEPRGVASNIQGLSDIRPVEIIMLRHERIWTSTLVVNVTVTQGR